MIEVYRCTRLPHPARISEQQCKTNHRRSRSKKHFERIGLECCVNCPGVVALFEPHGIDTSNVTPLDQITSRAQPQSYRQPSRHHRNDNLRYSWYKKRKAKT